MASKKPQIMKTKFRISMYALLLAGLCSAALLQKQPQPGCGIYGKVKEKANGEKIAFAPVALYRNDSLISQTTTAEDGSYCFSKVTKGKYKLKVLYVGYHEKSLAVAFAGTPRNVEFALDSDVQLDEVEIAERHPQKRCEDRKDLSYKSIGAAPTVNGDLEGYASYAPTQLTYVSPTEFNTEEYRKIDDNGFKATDKDPLSTFSIDVDKASYSNARRFLTQGSLPPADAVRVEEFINYFSYSYPQPTGKEPFSINTRYLDCPWNSGHRLVHIGLQGREVKTENLPANNLVFLLDVSGSMESADKLPLLKSGLRLLVDQLRAEDRVSIVVYAGAAGVVLEPTAGNRKEVILAALDQLQAGGSTAGGEGIQLAYKMARQHYLKEGNNRVILATDGDFNVGVSSEGELVRLIEKERGDGVFLTVLGFGTGNIKDSHMEQLADKGNGNYAYIDNILEAKKTLVKEMGGTLLTIAKDVKIQIEFNPAKVKGYRLVGYENRLLNKEDFNDDKKDAGELGAGHTVTAIYEIIPAGSDEMLASVDSLKYQPNVHRPVSFSNEVMTVKLRYKLPTEDVSKLTTTVVADKLTGFDKAPEDVRFATAVASFGMLLRNSEYKGSTNYSTVLAQARSAKGKDEDGYRAEFIRLVEMAELLNKKQ